MTEPKLLAEWFWIDRWVGSTAFLLPIDARGLYREMLTQAWRREARLLNHPETIRRAVGVTVKEWNRCWPLVERFWRVEGGYLVNDTQREVYADAKARQDIAITRASTAARARWQKSMLKQSVAPSLSNAQASPDALLEECPLSLSPSLSPKIPPKKFITALPDEQWERFKATYPGKGREQGYLAQQAFLAGVAAVGFAVLLAGVERYAKSKAVKDGYVMGMGKWLEKGLWIQEPEVPEDTKAEGLRKFEVELARIDAEKAARGR